MINNKRIFISTSSFGEVSKKPLLMLEASGFNISLNPLGRKLGEDEINELAGEFDGLIAGTEELSLLVENSTTLKIISRVGAGLNSVPLELCKQKDIKVSCTPNAVTTSVAELTIGLILSVIREIPRLDRMLRQGYWERYMGSTIENSVVGVVGFGKIGAAVVNLIKPFRPLEIMIVDTVDRSNELLPYIEQGLNIKQVSKDEMLRNSDIITLHAPFIDETKNYIAKEELELMKPSSILINAARGGIVNEDDLFTAIKENKIHSAALDVFDQEPYAGSLVKLDNIILTSHVGSYTSSCRAEMEMQAAEEIIRFFNNESLQNQVS